MVLTLTLTLNANPNPNQVSNVLSRFDAAWYGAQVATPNEAARAVHAQRQLTSYVAIS